MSMSERVSAFLTVRRPSRFCDNCIAESLEFRQRQKAQKASSALATTNVAYDELQQVLNCVDSKVYAIGDCVAPRQAPYAFYEGRKIALEL